MTMACQTNDYSCACMQAGRRSMPGNESGAACVPNQALNSADPPLKPGGRVLVHGGAGGVGHLAIQLAKKHWKAYVVTTAGPTNVEFIKQARSHPPAAPPHAACARLHVALCSRHQMSPCALHDSALAAAWLNALCAWPGWMQCRT